MEKSFSFPDPLESERVRLANAAFYKAFESLDVLQMADVWRRGEHVRCVHPGGELLSGYNAVMRSWEEIFSNTISIRFDLSNLSIHLRGELAWVTLLENVSVSAHTGLSRGVMIATNVFEHAEDRWQLIHHHAAPSPVGPPAAHPKQTLH